MGGFDAFSGHDPERMPSSAHLRGVDVPGVLASPDALRGLGRRPAGAAGSAGLRAPRPPR